MIGIEAAKIVAPFIDKTWPTDADDIYDILKLGINKAWAEGRWLGMTVEGYAKIYTDCSNQSYFIAPSKHPILLAVNIDGSPRTMRGKEFIFHKNGNGDLDRGCGCNWTTDVFDVGNTPYHNKLNINFDEGVTIGIRSLGPSGPNERVFINGSHTDGENVYTYASKEYGNPCGCPSEEKTQTVNGIQLDINEKFNYISNVKFSDILSINKTLTKSPIEVIAIDSSGKGVAISKMEPYETESKYRKYLVPNECRACDTVHGMFKIAKQGNISDTTELIISDEEALICLAIGIHSFYYKKQIDYGSQMIIQGITILEKEKRETESPSEFPIQVDNSLNDLPEMLKYIS